MENNFNTSATFGKSERILFRRDLDLATKTKGSDVKYSLLNVVIGMLAGLLIAGAFAKFWRSPAHAQVHRISVNYPSRWDAGEFRNCGLRQPHYSGDWPELDCDGSRQPIDDGPNLAGDF